MVTKNKNVFDWMNLGLSFSQAHSISVWEFGLSFWNQANASTNMVRPRRYGLKGSSQERVEAIPLVPANSARIGVIQHNEAATAVNIPTYAAVFDDFSVSILSYFFVS